MKKTFYVTLIFLLTLSFTEVNAQVNKAQEVPHHPVPKRHNTLQQKQKRSINSPNPYPTMKIDENDQYMGREKEFLNVMNVSSLPSDFPKYDKSLGMTGYNNATETYFRTHPELLKDKWKQKVQAN
ncbi:MAG: hypothetical protein ACXVPN_10890 [Bacteroidia bacterium]